MNKYLFQIKISHGYGMFDKECVLSKIIEAESKPDVIEYIQDNYPEYFDGNKVAQKLSKKTEQVIYVTIYQLTEYWEHYWTNTVECCVCGKNVPLIEIKNYLGDIQLSHFTCCPECEARRPAALEQKRQDNYEDYWSSRCEYYYIYKITNKINGQCYIGYTEREPLFRWWEHYKHSDLPIGKALNGEGIKNFTFEILEMIPKTDKTIQEMHDIETSYILKYDSINSGYNCVVSKTPVVSSKKLFDIE